MAAKQGCLTSLISGAIVIGLVAWGIKSCSEHSKEAERKEQQRRAGLTTTQREAEDRERLEAEAQAKAKRELEERSSRAQDVAKDYVRKFLKHPDDASFGFWDVPDVRCNQERDTFYISSKVKAKNDLGALLTYRWTAEVEFDGNTWRLVCCLIDGQVVYETKEPTLAAQRAEAKAQAVRKAEAQAQAARKAKIHDQQEHDPAIQAARKLVSDRQMQLAAFDAKNQGLVRCSELSEKVRLYEANLAVPGMAEKLAQIKSELATLMAGRSPGELARLQQERDGLVREFRQASTQLEELLKASGSP